MEARLVSHGNRQNAALYLNKSLLTDAILLLFSILTLNAGKQDYPMGKVDITGVLCKPL
jgi:hypothetical protein